MLIKHFNAYELIDPILYQQLVRAGLIRVESKNNRLTETFVHNRVRMLFPEQMLKDLSVIRKKFGAIYINRWHNQYKYILAILTDRDAPELYYQKDSVVKNAGTRPFKPSIGRATSMHCFNRAIDLKLANHEYDADDVRRFILTHQDKMGVKRLEDGISWVHMDYMDTGLERIKVFSI